MALGYITLMVSCGNHSHGENGHSHNADTEHVDNHSEDDHDHDHSHEGDDDHNHGSEVSATEVSHQDKGKEFTSAYICPMHCKDSGSDSEGKCPVCNMAYVAKADHYAKAHTH